MLWSQCPPQDVHAGSQRERRCSAQDSPCLVALPPGCRAFKKGSDQWEFWELVQTSGRDKRREGRFEKKRRESGKKAVESGKRGKRAE